MVHYPGMPAGTVEAVPILPAGLLNRAHELAADAGCEHARSWTRQGGDPDGHRHCGAGPGQASESVQLLVVGNRGRSKLRSTVLGSVSLAVAAHAHCPVIVVREGAVVVGPEHGVVVGIDGSLAGDRALDVAADVADRAGAPPGSSRPGTCRPQTPGRSPYWETAPLEGDWARTQHDIAVKVGAAAADRAQAQHPGLVATSEVHQGSAGAALIGASDQAGLVVVGSRGLGGFAGLVLGSVSHHVIHACVCPVMVVRKSTSNRPETARADVMTVGS